MHHDSSAFLPRYLTAFYYLNNVEAGGETAFPAADGAMVPAEAMALKDPAAAGVGLVVRPRRGAALLWYNHDESGAIDASAVHAGCRVKAGEKWGANHWVRAAAPPRASPQPQPQRPRSQQPQQEDGQAERVQVEADAGSPNSCSMKDAEDSKGAPTEPGKNAAKNRKKREKAAAKKRVGVLPPSGSDAEDVDVAQEEQPSQEKEPVHVS